MMDKRASGIRGEALAQGYLAGQGYRLRCCNYRASRCEVDIIAEFEGVLVFAEVKARYGDRYGLGREAVTIAKQRHIIQVAQAYIAEQDLYDMPVRFDVLEVDLTSGRVEHIPGAFTL
ncbi:MAG: YraN family protein [Christensenellaceae bacterium]|jgi:putative endonuclease|nr:YraN family protein [Christensenellaceae bacterium]